jgi:hypothetical protein
MSRLRRSWSGGHILGDDRSCGELWLQIGDLMILEELNPGYLLNHHHDLWGISTTVESYPRDADNLLKHIVKHRELLLLDIELNQISLVLRTSGGISNPGGQSSTEKVVKSVQLWQKVQHLGQMSLST